MVNSSHHIPACLLVFTTLPDESTASSLARCLVEQKLAACVNILPKVTAIYRWNNTVCESMEYTLLIKILENDYSKLERFLCARHPYQLPEIIAIPIQQGLPTYLEWIKESTQA